VAYKALPGGGYEVLFVTGSGCGANNDVVQHRVRVERTGEETELETRILEKGTPGCAEGRRPEGLETARPAPQPSSTAAYLAEAAYLEAASIVAFERLEADLTRLGAPGRLVRDARKSRSDEVRHARTMARLAKKYGGVVSRVEVAAAEIRSLEAIATENVIEGCVRETWAALLALYQAEHAADPSIAEAMRSIAKDEAFHAGLAWDVHTWAMDALDAAARGRVEQARLDAVTALFDELAVSADEGLQTFAGFPNVRDAVALLDALQQAISARLAKSHSLAA